MPTWKDALALRNSTATWWRNPAYIAWWADWQRTAGAPYIQAMPETDRDTGAYGGFKSRSIAEMPVYHVASEALDVLQAALPSFRPEPMLATDLITPSGFLVLERPLYSEAWCDEHIGPHGDPTGFESFDWFPREWSVGNHHDRDDLYGPIVLTWWPVDFPDNVPDLSQQGETIREYAIDRIDGGEHANGITLAAYAPAPGRRADLLAETFLRFDNRYYVDRLSITEQAHVLAFQVVMRMLQQRVFSGERQTTASKKSRRASKREPVLVISLPRRKAASGPNSDHHRSVEWSRRWWVNGFWRNQWYPSLQTHRQIWINGYVKGPQDKPFYTAPDRAFHA